MKELEKLQAEKEAIQLKIDSFKDIEKLTKPNKELLLAEKKDTLALKVSEYNTTRDLVKSLRSEMQTLNEEIQFLQK